MPNNRRGFGGLEYIFGEVDGVYWESIKVNNWPTSPDIVPVGGVWRDGNLLKVVYPSSTELLPNGGFEEGTDEWTIPGSGISAAVSTDPGTFIEGSQSLFVQFTDPANSVTQDLTLTPDTRYLVRGAILCASTGPILVTMSKTGSYIVETGTAVPDVAEWQYFEFDFTADQYAYTISLSGLTSDSVAYFDGLSIREILT